MGCSSSKDAGGASSNSAAHKHNNNNKLSSGNNSNKHTNNKNKNKNNSSDHSTSLAISSDDAATATATTTENANGYCPVVPPATRDTPTTTVVVGNLTVHFAAGSRQGRDPEIVKPNQDAYSIHVDNFCQTTTNAFWGVHDGHGPAGHDCSQFVRQRLPLLVENALQQAKVATVNPDPRKVKEALHKAHLDCNDEMHLDKNVDDLLSGTTSISLYLQGQWNRITVANVGDSRAILGSVVENTTTTSCDDNNTCDNNSTTNDNNTATARYYLKAVPLSHDQTPHRQDEATRCQKAGARILSFHQIHPGEYEQDDEIEDPLRVWSPHGKYPGTAFTRSLGDVVAESLGVCAEPELLSLTLTSNDKIAVLASDGIFDVLPNQRIIDVCGQYYHQQDPAQACRAIMELAEQEWMKNEDCLDEAYASFDDMTIICLFFKIASGSGDGDNEKDECWCPAAAATTAAAADQDKPGSTSTLTSEEPGTTSHPKRIRQKTLRNLEEIEPNLEEIEPS